MRIFCFFVIAVVLREALAFDHTIVVPKAFRVGATENVILNLHGYGAATVSAYLQDLPQRQNLFSEVGPLVYAAASDEPILLRMKVKSGDILNFRNHQLVALTIEVTGSDSDFTKTLEVFVSKESGYLFVITDRPTYKPNDKVLVKVFPLDQLMRQDETLVTITVKTPDGIGIDKSNKILTKGKVIESVYELSEVPELGIWMIEAKYSANGFETTADTTFSVQRYVLPTFQVKIIPDKSFILLSDMEISGSFKATYSYGEPVSGSYFLSLRLKKTPDSKPIEFYKRPDGIRATSRINGKRQYAVAIDNLSDVLEDGEDLSTLAESGATVFIQVTVRGQADGILESAISSEFPFLRSPFIIDTKRVSKYYTPGLAYKLQVDLQDALRLKAAPSVNINITVGIGADERRYEAASDNRGSIDFQIDFQGNQLQQIRIITADNNLAEMDQAETSFSVNPYSSPSMSYLQVKTRSNVATVEQRNFFLTFSYNQENIPEIRYYVTARGTIVAYGINRPNEGNFESTEMLDIIQKMVPSARVVAYYMQGTEVVSNSVWFDVEDQCETELSVSVPERVKPGQQVNFEITGPSNALVSLSGVDRAAYFLYDGGRLTRDEMFSKMEDYDQGCVRHGGANGRNVFTEAGLSLSTKTISPPIVNSLDCNAESGRKKRKVEVTIEENNELVSLIEHCDRVGRLPPAVPGESCESRAKRCRKNENDTDDCCDVFLVACQKATRERIISLLRGRSGRSNSGDRAEAEVSIAHQRSDFKESLIFTTKQLDQNGRIAFSSKARDSITTFDIDAISMADKEDGFCIAQPSELKVFKDVFVQLYTPYSLKKREQTVIRFTALNYDKVNRYNLIVEVRIDEDGCLCSHFPAGKWAYVIDLNVEREETASGSITVLPLKIPNSNTASIEIRLRNANGGDVLDSVKRDILIEDAGEIKDTYKSYPIDLKNDRRQVIDITFDFPMNIVPSTRQCWIYAYVNFLGPSIEIDPVTKEPNNVDKIFRMPRGCGEQTLLFSGPNIYAHMYLEGVGKLMPGTDAYIKSIARMNAGYARNLGYRSDKVNKRAFAVYANHDPSTWLNAFACKVYSKAKDYARDLDIGPICSALEWLLGEQEADGGFRELKRVYHREMHGAVGGKLTMTAYVLITLMETQSRCTPELNARIVASTQIAVAYLNQNKNDVTFMERPYALAILAYALALHEPNSAFFQEINARLLSLRQVNGNEVFWKVRHASDIAGTDIHAYWYTQRPQAVDVEATAYALLAQIEKARFQIPPPQSTLDLTRKIVLWLIGQRNEGGAFISTQDTVIGLQALATYQMWIAGVDVNDEEVDINLLINSNPGSVWHQPGANIHLTIEDEGVKKSEEVPKTVTNAGGVIVTATGTGEGVISYRCVYRTVVDEESCHFEINYNVAITNAEEVELNRIPMIIKLTITVRKLVGDPAQMSIVDVGLLSGFLPVESTIRRISIVEAVDGVVDRYEISDQNVVFYLPEITQEGVVIAFDMIQNIPVRRPEPAKINVYDYYEPFIHCGQFYTLPGNVPDLRTSNCDGDDNDDAICKCAEGGCLSCRTRDQQLNEATCLRDHNGECVTCNGPTCHDIYETACRSNYFYLINVTSEPIPGDIFVSFTADILRIMKRGDDATLERNGKANFHTRSDCYDKCRDEALETAARNNDESGHYLRVGNVIAVGGSSPDVIKAGDGEVHQYRLDENSVLERYIPEDVCERARLRYFSGNYQCNNSNFQRNEKKQARCAKWRKIKQACETFTQLEIMLEQGCD